MRAFLLVAAVAVMLLASCGNNGETVSGAPPQADKRLGVTSPYFKQGQRIPVRFSCNGQDVSPALNWRGVPAKAKEIAVLVEDPEAANGIFVHWAAWGISPKLKGLPVDPHPSGLKQAKNSFGHVGYDGPCPPNGDAPHRYVFHVYALRKPLGLDDGVSPQTVRQTIATVAEAHGSVTGMYGR